MESLDELVWQASDQIIIYSLVKIIQGENENPNVKTTTTNLSRYFKMKSSSRHLSKNEVWKVSHRCTQDIKSAAHVQYYAEQNYKKEKLALKVLFFKVSWVTVFMVLTLEDKNSLVNNAISHNPSMHFWTCLFVCSLVKVKPVWWWGLF